MLAWHGGRTRATWRTWQVKLPERAQFFARSPSNPFLAEAPLFDPSPFAHLPNLCDLYDRWRIIETPRGVIGITIPSSDAEVPAYSTSYWLAYRCLHDYCLMPDWLDRRNRPHSSSLPTIPIHPSTRVLLLILVLDISTDTELPPYGVLLFTSIPCIPPIQSVPSIRRQTEAAQTGGRLGDW